MKEVATLLGLELDEEFRMDNRPVKYKLTKDGFMYWSDEYQRWNYTCGIEALFLGKRRIVKISEPILNEKEKEYLSAVIKPFRDKVISITNYYEESIDNNFIEIEVKQNYCNENQYVSLPYFKKGKMYKGMEEYKKYTLEELEL